MRFQILVFLSLSLLAANDAPAEAEQAVGRCIDVVDGDTLRMTVGGEAQTVHLAAVDAPELDQAHGLEAREFLAELALDQDITVIPVATSETGEIQAKLSLGDHRDLNLAMLEAGLAWHDIGRDQQEHLAIAEIVARSAQLGLWIESEPTAPWLWRKRKARVRPRVTPTPTPKPSTLAELAGNVDLNDDVDHHIVIADTAPTKTPSKKKKTSPPSDEKPRCCCIIETTERSNDGYRTVTTTNFDYFYEFKSWCEDRFNTPSNQTRRCVDISYCYVSSDD